MPEEFKGYFEDPEPEPYKHEVRSDQELKKLAQDIFSGHVFGSWFCEDPRDVASSFMPIIFMASIPEDVVHVYEYLEKAGPRCINGRPIFFSMHLLVKEEFGKIIKYIKVLEKQRTEFMDE